MTLATWLVRYYIAIPVIAGSALLVFGLGWYASWLGRERYVDKRIADGVEREHGRLLQRLARAEAMAESAGIMMRVTAHEVEEMRRA